MSKHTQQDIAARDSSLGRAIGWLSVCAAVFLLGMVGSCMLSEPAPCVRVSFGLLSVCM